MTRITDGTGAQYHAKVDASNRIHVLADTRNAQHNAPDRDWETKAGHLSHVEIHQA